jgi:hypothetical protein
VRREALPLALRRPEGRGRLLAKALADEDERVVRIALLEVQQGLPDAVLPTLVNRVVQSPERSAELRTLGVKALAGSRSPLALTTLLEQCTSGRSLLGRTKLKQASPEMVEALGALAAGWAEREEVKEVLDQASRSKDPQIRRAASRGGGKARPGAGGTA